MTIRRLTFIVVLLAFIGLADAWYLAETALQGDVPTCNVAAFSNCAEVAQSKFAQPFGIPLGVYGSGFAAVVFMLAAIALIIPERRIYTALFGISILGAIGSVFLIALQLFVIKASCIYCLLFELIAFALLATTYLLYRKTR